MSQQNTASKQTSVKLPEILRAGHARFHHGRLNEMAADFSAQAHTQSPPVMIISCADSRVDPGTIFDAGPGQLFVVRNVANLVPSYLQDDGVTLNQHSTAAAVEFAVKALGISELVVMGHGGCGGVSACLALKHEELPFEFVGPWVDHLNPARDKVLQAHGDDAQADLQQALEFEGVRQSLENLAAFPFVAQAMASGTLRLHGAWFAIGSAELRWMGDDRQFHRVEQPKLG